MASIGERIKRIRNEKGLTQKELAKMLGTSQQNLAQYERNKRNPKYETVKKIANALEIDIYDLYISGDMTPREAMEILRSTDAVEAIKHSTSQTDGEMKLAHRIKQFEEMVKTAPLFIEKSKEIERKNLLSEKMDLLNTKGQDRVLEYTDLLTKDSKYLKE